MNDTFRERFREAFENEVRIPVTLPASLESRGGNRLANMRESWGWIRDELEDHWHAYLAGCIIYTACMGAMGAIAYVVYCLATS